MIHAMVNGSDIDEDPLDCIPQLVTAEDNSGLLLAPSLKEVKKTIFSLSCDSAPGPDGFFGYFFTPCRDIVGEDICAAVKGFFSGGNLPRSYTSANLVLIPKKENPEVMADFQTISLCNFSFKIIAKIFSTRLATLLPNLIAEEHGAFVQGERLTLLKHVLASMPIHALAALDLPKAVIGKFCGICADFLWGSSEWGKRHHWVSWNKVCTLMMEGGLGVRRLEDVALSLRVKGLWCIVFESSLWSNFFKVKFFKSLHIAMAKPSRIGSKSWRNALAHKDFFHA
ncbi:uncharacterized protein LOC122665498 [Telopea speciosissima]|uniref:uncharacterized protein LOC122665498 n=1 Tax=Telopea speciosissima TaxID=54955 RepID=UPI001CC4527E|nr:uncharacterized protein LOC122665498 [Telopea speciosissima]